MPGILIVGGGPTGLILAISLATQNVDFRIIDAALGPGTQSRAMSLHARILELYRPYGLDTRAVEDGMHSNDSSIRVVGSDGKPFEVARLPFSSVGKGFSRYPFILQYPQDHHERLLVEKLQSLGVEVERNTHLESLTQTAEGVQVLLSGPKGEEKQTYTYVCGADGAHSKVRHEIGVGFSGGTYEQPFYVADVKLVGSYVESFMVTLSAKTLCVRLPVRSTGMTRLIGLVPKHLEKKPDITFDDVRESVRDLVESDVEEVNWFSKYTVHHRVADKYRLGNVFLLGDAAHVHSPMGGQGMNTGIGDSLNLGWKLAHVCKNMADDSILDSYEVERRAFGEVLVNTTDRAFGIVMQDSLLGRLIRRYFWPLLISIISRFTFARKRAFRFMSQIHITYVGSSLSSGKAGAVAGGDRMPWVDWGNDEDNYGTLDGKDWQIHVYGAAQFDLDDLAWIPVHRFPFDAKAKAAGIVQDAVYLLRPDGHIGLLMRAYDAQTLRDYAARLKLRKPAASSNVVK